MRRHMRFMFHAVVVVLLTLITQIGGLAYLLGLGLVSALSARRFSLPRQGGLGLLVAAPIYLAMTYVLVPPLAAAMGRVRMPCETRSESPLVAASKLTCVLNRSYVRPEVYHLLMSLGVELAQRFPGSQVTALEGNFPFADGFPLLPHLSHRDGKKLDLAFLYKAADKPVAHGSPSRVGYFVYEQPRPGEPAPCAGRWSLLRWDFNFAQPKAPLWRLDEERTTWMLKWLKDHPQISRVFIEPHLAERLGVAGGKVRFQGCHAARHDDHIHIEVP